MNSTLVSPIYGMGFVPGVVRGKLTRNPASRGILLADHKILRVMSASPAGCVLLDAAPFSHASIGLLSRGIPTVIIGTEEGIKVLDLPSHKFLQDISAVSMKANEVSSKKNLSCTSLAWNKAGTHLFSGWSDNFIRVYNIEAADEKAVAEDGQE